MTQTKYGHIRIYIYLLCRRIKLWRQGKGKSFLILIIVEIAKGNTPVPFSRQTFTKVWFSKNPQIWSHLISSSRRHKKSSFSPLFWEKIEVPSWFGNMNIQGGESYVSPQSGSEISFLKKNIICSLFNVYQVVTYQKGGGHEIISLLQVIKPQATSLLFFINVYFFQVHLWQPYAVTRSWEDGKGLKCQQFLTSWAKRTQIEWWHIFFTFSSYFLTGCVKDQE